MLFTEQDALAAAAALGLNLETEGIPLRDWTAGMNTELKHGTVRPETDITGNDPIKTAKIALAHLRESLSYYAPKVGLEAWENSLRKGVKKRSMKTERKTLAFKTEDYDEESGIFSGYASVCGIIDTGGDIVEPGAFTKTIAEGWERVKILALHNDGWLPIGKPLELREDANGLFIKAKISDTSMGRDIKVLLKDRVLGELSIGYDPVIFDYDENGIRHLREVKLWEVSVVTWAMNPEATITDYKAATEAAARARAIASEAQAEQKEGRKISGARLKALEDASSSMKGAAKVIDALIKEARTDSGKSAARSPRNTQHKQIPGKRTPSAGTVYEILF